MNTVLITGIVYIAAYMIRKKIKMKKYIAIYTANRYCMGMIGNVRDLLCYIRVYRHAGHTVLLLCKVI